MVCALWLIRHSNSSVQCKAPVNISTNVRAKPLRPHPSPNKYGREKRMLQQEETAGWPYIKAPQRTNVAEVYGVILQVKQARDDRARTKAGCLQMPKP